VLFAVCLRSFNKAGQQLAARDALLVNAEEEAQRLSAELTAAMAATAAAEADAADARAARAALEQQLSDMESQAAAQHRLCDRFQSSGEHMKHQVPSVSKGASPKCWI